MQAREVVSFFQRGVINQAINGVEGRKVTSDGTPDEGISMYSSAGSSVLPSIKSNN